MHKKIGPYKGTVCGFSAICNRIPTAAVISFCEAGKNGKRGRAVYQDVPEIASPQ